MTAVRDALAVKEHLVGFMANDFENWHLSQQVARTGFGTQFDTGEARSYLKTLMGETIAPAELFVIEPVMSGVVKMAAEDLPSDACFQADDMPTDTGLIYLADPFPVEEEAINLDVALLDAISWRVKTGMVFVIGWVNARTATGRWFRSPVSMRNVGFDIPLNDGTVEQQLDRSIRATNQINSASMSAALTHMLSALRIMQQPYAVATREHAPRASARRLARQDATSDITVITFRQPDRTGYERPDDPSWTLDHRVLVRGHWRRHQKYKTKAGEWAEKEIYIAPYIKGPEGTPLVITKKVNDLIR